jgi:small GTP-binding protein
MGSVASAVVSYVSPQKDADVVIVGLDAAGKTTLLFKLTGVPPTREIQPTVGFETKSLQINKLHLQLWDLGGETTLRPMWRMYYKKARGLVFVIDSSDRTRMGLAVTEFTHLLNEAELRGVPILIIANKKDKPGRMKKLEIIDGFHLRDIKDRQWSLSTTDALSGEGVAKAFEWMTWWLDTNM